MSVRISPALSWIALAGLAAAGGACAPVDGPGGYVPPPIVSSAFNPGDFAWSTHPGDGGIDGRVVYSSQGRVYACTGSVALTPDTPYTRARFRTLYGATDQAAIPEAVVRARTVSDPNADYRSFVRSATCANGRFAFSGLPDGGWFIIVPVTAGGDDERTVLMRHIDTRAGRRIAVTL